MSVTGLLFFFFFCMLGLSSNHKIFEYLTHTFYILIRSNHISLYSPYQVLEVV